MCDGYNYPPKDDYPDLEDELLCEYVDGTMDPLVRDVFEEYLCANPEIRDHVECLRDTRLLLCRYGCRCHAPRDLQDRLRRRITCDMSFHPVSLQWAVGERLKGATMSSAVAILLVLGLAGGVSVMSQSELQPSVMSATAVSAAEFTFGPERAVRMQYRNPDFSPRMSSLSPVSNTQITTSIVSSERAAPAIDTSLALLLEQSIVQP